MPKVLPPPSSSVTAWCATSFWPRSPPRSAAPASRCARRPAGLPRDRTAFGHSRLRQLSAEPSAHQQRSRAQGRHIRRMDRATHRHPRAPHRRCRRIDLRSCRARCARRARPCACRCPIDRSHRAGDLDARQHFPGQRGYGAGRSWHYPWRRIRFASGLLRLRLRAGDGGRSSQIRRVFASAGDRRRDVFAHSRLDRPLHLRAVRRRRRRCRARCAGPAGHARRPRHPYHPFALRRPAQVEALCRRRAVIDRHRRPPAHGGPRGFQHAVAMITDVVEDAFKATGYTADDVDWFIPHQANRRIIDGSAHKLGIAPAKSSSRSTATAIPRQLRFRWRLPTRLRTAASSAAISCCSKPWVAASPGGRRWCAGKPYRRG